jgi:hypothetical protein
MYRDDQIVCDSCQAVITRVTPPPEGGWHNLHALCSACFDKLRQTKS